MTRRRYDTRLLPLLPRIDVDVMSRATLNGKTATAQIVNAITDLEIELTMDGASVLALTLHDPDWKILNGPLLRDVVDLDLADPRLGSLRYWRMDTRRRAGEIGTEDALTTLRMWDLGSAALKQQAGFLRKSAATLNLEGWVRLLAREVSGTIALRPMVPRPGEAPPRDAEDGETEQDLGFSSNAQGNVTIKGVGAKPDQLRILNVALSRAVQRRAPARAALALVMALIQESTVRNLLGGDRDSSGPLQVRASTARPRGIDPRDTDQVSDEFLRVGYWGRGGAITLARKNPGRSPGWIAQQVQGSAYPSAYDPWEGEARRIIEQWSGRTLALWHTVTGSAATGTLAANSRSEWRRGTTKAPASSWTTLGETAEEMGRRRYVAVGSRLVMARDQDLIRARPHQTLRPTDSMLLRQPLLEGLSETIDLNVLIDGWVTPPGGVAYLADGQWGPADGPWLAQTITARAGQPTLDVTLTQPVTRKPQTQSRARPASTDPAVGGETGGNAAIKWATQQIGVAETTSNGGPKINDWQQRFGFGRVPWCGIFCGMAMRAAGVKDIPSGIASTAWIAESAAAKRHPFTGRTSAINARPGDLALIGPPGPSGHVALVVRANATRSEVETIEGNYGNRVARGLRNFSEIHAIAQVKYP